MTAFHPVVLNLFVENCFFCGRVFWHWSTTTLAFEAFATLFAAESWLAAIFSAALFSPSTVVFLTSQLFEINFAGISAATFLDGLASVSALNFKIVVTPILLST